MVRIFSIRALGPSHQLVLRSRCVGLFLAMLGAFSWCQAQSTESDSRALFFRYAPCHFIPHSVYEKSAGQDEQSQTIAWIISPMGRIHFGPHGASLCVPRSETPSPSMEDGFSIRKRLPDSLSVRRDTVLMRVGFEESDTSRCLRPPRLEELTGAHLSFFVGPRQDWRTGVPTYRRLVYPEAFDGIDLEFLGHMDRLEYRLMVQSGARVQDIIMTTGAEQTEITEDGGLLAHLDGARLAISPPRAFQTIEGLEYPVDVAFVLLDQGQYTFRVGAYDHRHPLIIDPVLSWSTFLGGGAGGYDDVNAMAVDASGQAVVVGTTPSTEFPVTLGGYDSLANGNEDAFVVKLNEDASDLVWGTFLGGAEDDGANAVDIGSAGQVFVLGTTSSSPFPTTAGAYDPSYNGGGCDAFITVLNASGNGLLYSTYLGGSDEDKGAALVVNNDVAHVTGTTKSPDFPAPGSIYQGLSDVFVTRLAVDGSSLLSSLMIGGQSSDRVTCIAVEDDQTYIAGFTWAIVVEPPDNSPGEDDQVSTANLIDSSKGPAWPVTIGAWDTTHASTLFNNSSDGFVTKIDTDGLSIVYSTFLGSEGTPYSTDGDDSIYGLAVKDGCAYVTGKTESLHFPVTPNHFGNGQTSGASFFVTKFNAAGSDLAYSGIVETPGIEYGQAIAVDDADQVVVVGLHGRLNPTDPPFPTTPGAYDTSYNLNTDGFVMGIDAAGENILFSTFLGGGLTDQVDAIRLHDGDIFVCGITQSPDFPTSTTALLRTHQGFYDAFVAKLDGTASSLLYSTLLGGGKKEYGYDMTTADGTPHVVGSIDQVLTFPASQTNFDPDGYGSGRIGFVTKMEADGSDFVWSAVFGGHGDDIAHGVAVNGGFVYLTGTTRSTDFPVSSGAFDETHNGGIDAFVLKISDDGQTLHYGTYLGGVGNDEARAIAVNNSRAYVGGYTTSSGYPTTPSAHDPTHNGGGYDAFVTRINADGSGLDYSTFLGGSGSDYAYGLAVSSAYASVVGKTSSSGFPTTTTGYDTTYGGSYDGYVVRLTPSGGLDYGSFLGGSGGDAAWDVDVDTSLGYLTIVGNTSGDFPVTGDAFQSVLGGGDDAFVIILHPVIPNTLTYSTYVGGTGDDEAWSVDFSSGKSHVVGVTDSIDLPVTPGAYDTSHNGLLDGFMLSFARTNPAGTSLS